MPERTVLRRLQDLLRRQADRDVRSVVSPPVTPPTPTTPALSSQVFHEALERINPSNTMSHRLRFLREFSDIVKTYSMENIVDFWVAVSDLVAEGSPPEARQAGFQFLCALIEGQYDNLGLIRKDFFTALQGPPSGADFSLRVYALRLLTKDGREVFPFTFEVGELLAQWVPSREHFQEVIPLATNVLKFNFMLLEEDVVDKVIRCVSTQCYEEGLDVGIINCVLTFFDVLIRYGNVPINCVEIVLHSLCALVNISSLCHQAWNIMRNLLSSPCGHKAFQTLLSILDNPNTGDETSKLPKGLLRGAVFFVGMSSWGSQRVASLHAQFSVILPSLVRVLSSNQEIVAHEVALSVRRLVNKYGAQLRVDWDALLDLLSGLFPLYQNEGAPLLDVVKEMIAVIEDLYRKGEFFGLPSQFFGLLELYAAYLPESSAVLLLKFKMEGAHPACNDWLQCLQQIMEIFLRGGKWPDLRQEALRALKFTYELCESMYEEEIIEHVVLPYLGDVLCDPDADVRRLGVLLLVEIAHECRTSQFADLLGLLQRAASAIFPDTREFAVTGLISIFRSRFVRIPCSHPIQLFQTLIKFIDAEDVTIRRQVLSCLLELHATPSYRMMLGKLQSPNLFCIPTPALSRVGGIIYMNQLLDPLLLRLQLESNGELFLIIIQGLDTMLQSRYIFCDVDLGKLSSLLAWMLQEKSLGSRVVDVEPKARVRYQELGYRMLALLVGYATALKEGQQEDIVNSILAGVIRSHQFVVGDEVDIQRVCIRALSVCCVEMPHIIAKYLSLVLRSLTKVADVDGLRTAILEFLHDLVLSPNLPNLLDGDQRRRILAVLLSFTDLDTAELPSQYVNFTYKVMTLWFLRCSREERSQHYLFLMKPLLSLALDKQNRMAEIEIDVITRATYGDFEDVEMVDPAAFIVPEAHTKTWIHGTSLITVQSNRTGYAEITVRRASGQVRLSFHIHNNRRAGGMAERMPLYSVLNMYPGLTRTLKTMGGIPPSAADAVDAGTRDVSVSPFASWPIPHAHAASPVRIPSIPMQGPFPPIPHLSSSSGGISHLSSHGSVLSSEGALIPEEGRNGETRRDAELSKSLPFQPLMSYDVEDSPRPSDGESEGVAIEQRGPRSGDVSRTWGSKRTKDSRAEDAQGTSPSSIPQRVPAAEEESVPTTTIQHPMRRVSIESAHSDAAEKSLLGIPFSAGPTARTLLPSDPLNRRMAHDEEAEAEPVDPAFVFLQLHHFPFTTSGHPLVIPNGEALDRALSILDKTPCVDTFKIGVLYVASGQENETQILGNLYGSPRYTRFLSRLGEFVRLKDCRFYTGGLDTRHDIDGEYGIFWRDHSMQVAFHASTLMPNEESDPNLLNKKCHIGNDSVHIVFSDSEKDYEIGTIPGEFNFVHIMVLPLDEGTYRVEVKRRPGVDMFGPVLPSQIVSEEGLPRLVRQTAIHAVLATMGAAGVKIVTNWEERLNQILRLKERLATHPSGQGLVGNIIEFLHSE